MCHENYFNSNKIPLQTSSNMKKFFLGNSWRNLCALQSLDLLAILHVFSLHTFQRTLYRLFPVHGMQILNRYLRHNRLPFLPSSSHFFEEVATKTKLLCRTCDWQKIPVVAQHTFKCRNLTEKTIKKPRVINEKSLF